MKKHRWDRLEKLLFALVVLLNLLPFLSVRFFPSLDGASHLMNANIINQILIWHNDLFQQFFRLNPEPVPNWTTHFILAFFQLFLPAYIAEKILLLALLIGLPFAFRRLIHTLAPGNVLFSYLIFPFTHSLFLFFGFYNFYIAVIILFLTLNFWIAQSHKLFHFRTFLSLVGLILLTYFSHILVFAVLLLFLASYLLAEAFFQLPDNSSDYRTPFIRSFKKLLFLLAASIVPVFLFFFFFITRSPNHQISFLPKTELIQYLFDIRPLISFNPILERKFTIVLFSLFLLILMIALFRYVRKKFFSQSRDSLSDKTLPYLPKSNRFTHYWLMINLVILLFLYYFFPNSYGTASYISLRLLFIFYLVLILWITAIRIPYWTGILSIAVSLWVNFSMSFSSLPVIRDYSKIALECNKASEFVAPNSVLLQINLSENWFISHFIDYVAIDKPILGIYNYEAETGYFPLIWDVEKRPNFFVGNFDKPNHYHTFISRPGHPILRVNYLFFLGELKPSDDPFFAKLPGILATEYDKVYEEGLCKLYQRK